MTYALDKILQIAVEKNIPDLLSWVFTQGTPSNVKECLVMAVEKQHIAIIETLTEQLTKISKSSPIVQRPLVIITDRSFEMSHLSTNTKNNSVLMETLISSPEKAYDELCSGIISLEEINHPNNQGWTALMYVCRQTVKIGDVAYLLIQKLLDLGADINATDCSKWTSLMYVCYYGMEKACEILLKHPKIDINAKDNSEATALSLACFNNAGKFSTKIVTDLLKMPLININQTRFGTSILMLLCNTKQMGLVELCLKYPTLNVLQRDSANHNILYYLQKNFTKEQFNVLANLVFAHPGWTTGLVISHQTFKNLSAPQREVLADICFNAQDL